jgi:uncharacterized protein (TIGR02453 family)
MPPTAYFGPDLFRFLRDLATHNDRDWFRANKERYERSVRDPLLRFVSDLQPRLAKISPRFVADPRPVGGSMMRIQRDTRFSKDKAPYKTAVMAHFWHASGQEGATPAFYLRLEPGRSMAGGGIWHPEPAALKRIRATIVDDGAAWRRIRKSATAESGYELAGESLKRAPVGFDADHPFVDDLKRKDFALVTQLDERRIVGGPFMADVVAAFKRTAPLLSFLSRAVGLRF